MTSPDAATVLRALASADVAITAFLLLAFGGGFLVAGDWPARASLFPRLLTAVGFGLAATYLVVLLWKAFRGSTTGVDEEPSVADTDDDEAQDLEYLFANAGRRLWVETGGWLLLFFVGLWVVGLFVIVPVFSLFYVRYVGRTSWLAAGIYAAVTWGVLYVAFDQVLNIAVPAGMF